MTQTVQEFMQANNIYQMSCDEIDERPDGISWGARHWLHVLATGDKTIDVYVSGGKLAEPSTVEEVFAMALEDARDGKMDAFEWLETFYGDNPNYQEAKASYEVDRRLRRELREFLGDRLFARAMRLEVE